jgi:glycosyltransferase involved in cell wall biosynthesis
MGLRNGEVAFSPKGVVADPEGTKAVGGGRRKPLLLCLSHLRWDFVWQRPQHLLTRAAQHFDVVIFEEPEYRDEASARLDVSDRPGGIRVAVPVLPWGTEAEDALTAQRRLLELFLAGETQPSRLFWYYTPMAMAFSGHLACDVCVYDNMDELSAFQGASPALLALEDDLFARADLVFTGGMSLYEAKRNRHPAVQPFPSSVDVAHFATARTASGPEPEDQAAISRPRLGFFGVLDERLDVELVGAVAAARPDWQIVMIGPTAKIDPETLPQAPNLHWLGPKSYAELPAYLTGWDVGFMPFALNESTRFISPTKTPEFLAAGVPVVSTPITDVVRPYGENGLVAIARNADEVVAAAERLMAEPKAPWLRRVDRHLATGSWDATWAAMQALVGELLGQPEARSTTPSGFGVRAAAAIPAE